MKLVTLTIFIFCMLLSQGCIKKSQKVTQEAEVIQLLNQSESEKALTKIDSLLVNDPNNQELLYLKASALSMSASVDVYKMFPLLKAKIFDVAITQWSEHRQFEKKMRERREGTTSIDIEDAEVEYVPLEDSEITFEFEGASIYEYADDSAGTTWMMHVSLTTDVLGDEDRYFYIDHKLIDQDDLLKLFKGYSGHNTGSGKEARIYYYPMEKNDPNSAGLNDLIVSKIKNRHQENWNYRFKKIKEKQGQLNAIRALWSVTDMIPLIKEIPTVDAESFKKLEVAQKILTNLIDKNRSAGASEIYQKSLNQLMMISGLRLIFRFQSAFDLSKIRSPYDLICQSNSQTAEMILDSREDVLYILQGIENEKIRKKNEEIFTEVEARLKEMNEMLKNDDNEGRGEYRAHILKSIQRSISHSVKVNCIGKN